MTNEQDLQYILRALELAKTASKTGKIPIGAVLVGEGTIFEAYNDDGIHHAELAVIENAFQTLNNASKVRKLENMTLYTTLEPCIMCAGAILNAHIPRVVFGAYDAKFGAAGSVWDLLRDPLAPHHPEVVGGVHERECAGMLSAFFEARR